MKALVLLNMASPSSLEEVELFLKNMFNDEYILPIKNSFLRSLVANLIVFLRKENAKSHYREIGGHSPLVEYTKKLIEKINIDGLFVTFAFRYTPPFSTDCILDLKLKGIDEVVLLPLYPQYSTTTTKTSILDFLENSKKLNFNPKFSTIENFYKDDLYNQSIIDRICESVENTKDYILIFSAHGLPQKTIDKGDPYQKEIEEHISTLKEKLLSKSIIFKDILLAYQSKVGFMKWLEPSLESVLQNLKNLNVLIFPLSFVFDNVETDYELSIEYKEIASKIGIQNYVVCKCPNDSEAFAKSIISLIK